jgi:hypothetical protein
MAEGFGVCKDLSEVKGWERLLSYLEASRVGGAHASIQKREPFLISAVGASERLDQ